MRKHIISLILMVQLPQIKVCALRTKYRQLIL